MKNYDMINRSDFLKKFNLKIDKDGYIKEINSDFSLSNNTGALYVFGVNDDNKNDALTYAILYLTALRLIGHTIPARIFLVDLARNYVYEYFSKDYLANIQKDYVSCWVIDKTTGYMRFQPGKKIAVVDYQSVASCVLLNLNNAKDKNRFELESRKQDLTKIDIDQNCFLQWASRYYQDNFSLTDFDYFINEIKTPTKFKDFINPYTGNTDQLTNSAVNLYLAK